MKANKRRTAAVILLLLMLFPIIPTAVWANSAPLQWNGTDASGVAVMTQNCPVTVKNEVLTFDIPTFPANYYRNPEALAEYRASVTAKYEFYNPKSYDVTATLAFPFGVSPEYVNLDTAYAPANSNRYGVKINGENLEATLRHTYFSRYGESFETVEHTARLELTSDGDGYRDTGLKSYTVTSYSYKVTDTEEGCDAIVDIDGIGESRYLISDHDYYSVHKDKVSFGIYIDEAAGRDGFTFYVIGEPLDDAVNPRLFTSPQQHEEAKGTVTLKSAETMTLYDLAMQSYDPEGNISELDHVNAVSDCILTYWEKQGAVPLINEIIHIDESLMQWYVYDMTVPAGETVTNEVTAPLYPDIDDHFAPAVYTYNYLLSPARGWAGFGKLDIEIITPYYLIEQDIFPKFQKTDAGYVTSLNGLPSGELSFSLSADPDPKREITPYTFLGIGLYIVIICVTVVLPASVIIAVTVILLKKRRRNN